MCLIAILAFPYAGASSLARRASEILGYRYLDDGTIFKKVGNWGAAPAALRAALNRNSGPLRRLFEKPPIIRAGCELIQAALADEVATGPAILCGRFA